MAMWQVLGTFKGSQEDKGSFWCLSNCFQIFIYGDIKPFPKSSSHELRLFSRKAFNCDEELRIHFLSLQTQVPECFLTNGILPDLLRPQLPGRLQTSAGIRVS